MSPSEAVLCFIKAFITFNALPSGFDFEVCRPA
jgi:hypothetical protein